MKTKPEILNEIRNQIRDMIKAYYSRNTRLGTGIVLYQQASEIADEIKFIIEKANILNP